jgi:hypothetical protein
VRSMLAAAVLVLPASVHPWPVGPGARFTPPPRTASAPAPASRLPCAAPGPAFRLHLELFVDRKVVIVPAGVGIAGPASRTGATVKPDGCTYPVRTVTPDGVVQVARGTDLRLADFFRVWGQPLGRHRLASFASPRPLRAYVGGKQVRGPAGAIRLAPHEQIVLELGAYVPPHPFFLFAGGNS